ncbi:unnamed protein product [Rhizoctonia solani]|uniref:F-box domain-containing protein n=1 Tax=Rhizoctonia solani TaxID=456999 RepID=A0A8H3E5G6_9AGAM|nr:unnamed protein product [Rhizoctonia solani]
MATFLDLPPECIVSIFLYLEPYQIVKGRLISHAFRTIIDDSLELQYIMELGCLGLIPPPTSSNELSLSDKVRVLKEKRRKIGACSIGADSMKHVYLDSKAHDDIATPFEFYTFSRGVFAFQGEDGPNNLGIYQLSSDNRGIDCDFYRLNCPPGNFMMAVEPSFDLLVLFAQENEEAVCDLRSIRTGLPHPSALCPRILCSSFSGIPILTSSTINIEIVGRHIVHTGEVLEPFASLITIWDWMSGQIVTSTKVMGYSSTFVSEDIFLVSSSIPGSVDPPPSEDSHHLALYTCFGVPPDRPARCVARFNFPTLDSVRMPSIRFEHSPLPSVWGYSIPHDVSPPRIYDTDSASHYLVLEMGFSGRGAGYGSLCIRARGLLSFVDTAVTNHSEYLSIPWSKWSSVASWVSHNAMGPGWSQLKVFGHIATLVSQGDKSNHWEVEIFDLRTSRRISLPGPKSEGYILPEDYIDFFLSSDCMSIPRPALPKSFSTPVENFPWDEHWYDTRDHFRGIDLMVDDEHIVIFQPASEVFKASLHVYSL